MPIALSIGPTRRLRDPVRGPAPMSAYSAIPMVGTAIAAPIRRSSADGVHAACKSTAIALFSPWWLSLVTSLTRVRPTRHQVVEERRPERAILAQPNVHTQHLRAAAERPGQIISS